MPTATDSFRIPLFEPLALQIFSLSNSPPPHTWTMPTSAPRSPEGNHPHPTRCLSPCTPSLSLSHAQHVSVGSRGRREDAEDGILVPCAACISRSTTHRRKTRIPPTHYLCQRTHHTPQKETTRHSTRCLSPCPPSLPLSHAQHVSVGARALRPFIGFSRGKTFQKIITVPSPHAH